ncbi:MAG: tRNA (guanosine(46)-N7)-methyltransferase TrmB [Alphaproteobacteria bacterium]|nr:tRNA (guanosine(46)-N7)-methyltransferase TrmB [Alphaproteobacteria bacterium]
MGEDGPGRRTEVGGQLSSATQGKRRLIYGRRQGRPLKAQARDALETVLPRLALDLDALGDLKALFPGRQDFALEIGFGGGEHLIAQAKAHPETGFIGAEPFINGVAKLADAARETPNLRLHHGDARDVLERLPDASLGSAFLLFPDPWPKLRHHKRRFVNQENLAALARVLAPGGRLRIASDIPDYVRWTLIEIARFNRTEGRGFVWTARCKADWTQRPADWPSTRYEAKALEAGRVLAYLEFERADRVDIREVFRTAHELGSSHGQRAHLHAARMASTAATADGRAFWKAVEASLTPR